MLAFMSPQLIARSGRCPGCTWDVEINSLEHDANAASPKKRKDATEEEVEEKELEPGDGGPPKMFEEFFSFFFSKIIEIILEQHFQNFD